MNETDKSYIAGLFDGEGSIDYAQRYKKIGNRRSLTWNILMRIQMTDEHVLRWVHKTLKVGTIRKKNRSPSIKSHWKDSWIYSVRYRQAYDVCKLLLQTGSDQSSYLTGYAPIQVASKAGHERIISLLVSYGSHVEDSGDSGRPPLVAAAAEGHVKAMTVLLDNGANIAKEQIESIQK